MFFPTPEQINAIATSPLFDSDWYARTYPDVGLSKISPAEHYARFGRLLERDPSAGFEGGFYIDTRKLRWDQNPVLYCMACQQGAADPFDPSRVPLAAANAGWRKGWACALELAREHLNTELHHTLHMLKANEALTRGDAGAWLNELNAFLGYWDTNPLALSGEARTLPGRLQASSSRSIDDGPKISVLMPAFNAENTIGMAVESVLSQTWRNLELIVVDDRSTDATWAALQALAERDCRLRLHRNPVNVGPYVSKNVALSMADGDWITGHDADDLALPNRLELQIRYAMENGRTVPASLSYMVRLSPEGMVSHIGNVDSFSPDGVARVASISCFFNAAFLRDRLGYWDGVRFGADTEMIERARRLAGPRFGYLRSIVMLCLDLKTSLTNNVSTGIDRKKGLSPPRAAYRDGWQIWHDTHSNSALYLPFPQRQRRYKAAVEMCVPLESIREAYYRRRTVD